MATTLLRPTRIFRNRPKKKHRIQGVAVGALLNHIHHPQDHHYRGMDGRSISSQVDLERLIGPPLSEVPHPDTRQKDIGMNLHHEEESIEVDIDIDRPQHIPVGRPHQVQAKIAAMRRSARRNQRAEVDVNRPQHRPNYQARVKIRAMRRRAHQSQRRAEVDVTLQYLL